ncbi:MAG: sigma-70 family RNA polymerase sigma factor [Lachnospiraceae bacterium]|nr:sigma-70 family RNA polymerase sigma factor [Lachnospiraceae bacterium]
MEDREIIDLFFERSEQAIVELSEKYGALCLRTASHILNNREDAEECVNDAYLAVWNTVPPERPDPLLSYLMRIVRNIAIKKYHRNTAEKRNSSYDVALSEIEESFPSRDSVEEEVEARDTARRINRFLGTLDRKDRILFVRRYWQGDSVEELAKLFSITKHNVSVRLLRIRKKLSRYLAGEEVSS